MKDVMRQGRRAILECDSTPRCVFGGSSGTDMDARTDLQRRLILANKHDSNARVYLVKVPNSSDVASEDPQANSLFYLGPGDTAEIRLPKNMAIVAACGTGLTADLVCDEVFDNV